MTRQRLTTCKPAGTVPAAYCRTTAERLANALAPPRRTCAACRCCSWAKSRLRNSASLRLWVLRYRPCRRPQVAASGAGEQHARRSAELRRQDRSGSAGRAKLQSLCARSCRHGAPAAPSLLLRSAPAAPSAAPGRSTAARSRRRCAAPQTAAWPAARLWPPAARDPAARSRSPGRAAAPRWAAGPRLQWRKQNEGGTGVERQGWELAVVAS